MSETTDKNSNQNQCCGNCDYSLAFLVLRFWLAVRRIHSGRHHTRNEFF